ncbi:hypothetical protein V6N13_140690 [Hibiscus sabdariffa]|uniref:RING-type E3 ubiquitin transferase n=1 Tax=Hibiscus sabdariffa TaxID=183260 RepID=A0ABR2Q270_9ROSI
MGDRQASRYWCYMYSQVVNPRTDPEIKCPFYDSRFVEEMASIRNHSNIIDSGSVNNLSLWAPILLDGLSPSSQLHIASQDHINGTNSQDSLNELGREFQFSIQRRRRSSTSSIRMLQDMSTIAASESENSEMVETVLVE